MLFRSPRPPPCAPPPPAPAPRAPWASAAAGAACAKAEDASLIIRATAIATLVHIILFREAMVISRNRLVVWVTCGDIHDAAVRPRNRLEGDEGTSLRPCWSSSSVFRFVVGRGPRKHHLAVQRDRPGICQERAILREIPVHDDLVAKLERVPCPPTPQLGGADSLLLRSGDDGSSTCGSPDSSDDRAAT